MRLVLDAVGNKSGGGAIVLLELLNAMACFEGISHITVFTSPAALREFEIPETAKLKVIDVPIAESAGGRFFWAWRGLDRALKEFACDAFLGMNGIGSLNHQFASLVLVQQSLPYSREALRRYSMLFRFRMRVIQWITCRSVKAANHVLVQTEAMRELLSKKTRIQRNRISVFMPNARRLVANAESLRLDYLKRDPNRKRFLYVGGNAPHKNLEVVTKGLEILPVSQRPSWYATLHESSILCQHGSAICLGTLTWPELCEAYRNVGAVVMPSLSETVGLPMLEAMSVGTPVLAADRPYAHAVCEDAAVFFDPLSPYDFAKKLSRLFADNEWRTGLALRGRLLMKLRGNLDPNRGMIEKVVEVAEKVNQSREKQYRE